MKEIKDWQQQEPTSSPWWDGQSEGGVTGAQELRFVRQELELQQTFPAETEALEEI